MLSDSETTRRRFAEFFLLDADEVLHFVQDDNKKGRFGFAGSVLL